MDEVVNITYTMDNLLIDIQVNDLNIISFIATNLVAALAIKSCLDDIKKEKNNLLYLFHIKRVLALREHFAFTVNFKELDELDKSVESFNIMCCASVEHFIKFIFLDNF